MTEKLKNINDQISTLSSTISDIEMTLSGKELPFLQVLYQPVFTVVLHSDSKPHIYFMNILMGSAVTGVVNHPKGDKLLNL